jgi:hypothetical protein
MEFFVKSKFGIATFLHFSAQNKKAQNKLAKNVF